MGKRTICKFNILHNFSEKLLSLKNLVKNCVTSETTRSLTLRFDNNH